MSTLEVASSMKALIRWLVMSIAIIGMMTLTEIALAALARV